MNKARETLLKHFSEILAIIFMSAMDVSIDILSTLLLQFYLRRLTFSPILHISS